MDRVIQPGTSGSLFLDALPWESALGLVPDVRLVRLTKGHVVAEPGVPAEAVFFPVDCVISAVTRMADGSAVEVGLAGPEGMSPVTLAFGSRTGTQTGIVQIGGSACTMSASVFGARMEADAALHDLVLKYGHYSFTASAQFAACNRLHPIDQRYARWLLMADDRVGDGEFTLTQEYSAQMLGVRRAGVTVVAGEMSKAGLISYHRGRITILDHAALLAASCECYAVVNDELLRLLGYDIRRAARRLRDEKRTVARAAGA
jgi:CRP-like cAMP-binding protein